MLSYLPPATVDRFLTNCSKIRVSRIQWIHSFRMWYCRIDGCGRLTAHSCDVWPGLLLCYYAFCLYKLWRSTLVLTIFNAPFCVDITVFSILFENSFWLLKDLIYYLLVHLNSKKQNWFISSLFVWIFCFKNPRQFHAVYSSVHAWSLLPVYFYINSILAIQYLVGM